VVYSHRESWAHELHESTRMPSGYLGSIHTLQPTFPWEDFKGVAGAVQAVRDSLRSSNVRGSASLAKKASKASCQSRSLGATNEKRVMEEGVEAAFVLPAAGALRYLAGRDIGLLYDGRDKPWAAPVSAVAKVGVWGRMDELRANGVKTPATATRVPSARSESVGIRTWGWKHPG
jgi:hypothetical protein